MRLAREPVDEAEATLVEQGMPADEIRAVLGADDPLIVFRYLELHRERLIEGLDDQLVAVDRVERLLIASVAQRVAPRARRIWSA
jgi:hypothetical protein